MSASAARASARQDNSLISIPNNSVINTTVENLSLRPKRRQRFTVGVTYDTKLATLEAFVEGIRKVILEHDLTDKDNIQVSFNNLADSSLDILVIFHLLVTDYPSELKGRHEVLVRIMDLAERMGVCVRLPDADAVDRGVTGARAGPQRHRSFRSAANFQTGRSIFCFWQSRSGRAVTRAAIADWAEFQRLLSISQPQSVRSSRTLFAVGTIITDRPPHRSERGHG